MASEMEASGGDAGTTWTMASLRRTSDEMRDHIRRLKADLEQERNNVKRLEREKTMAVKKARDEEEALRRQSLDDLKQRLAREHKEKMQTLQDACASECESEALRVVRECEEKMRTGRMQWEAEKAAEMEHVRKTCSRKAREDAEAVLGLEKKKLTQELFEMSDARAQAEVRMKELQAADRGKAEDIRRMHDEHQAEMARLRKGAQQDTKRQMEELQEKKEQLSRKERELIDVKRRQSHIQMEKETLEDNLARVREADSWQRMSPRASLQGIGNISFDSATSPMKKQYGEREKQLIQRNSELSLLARRLEENLSAMTTEKESLDTQMQEAKLANKPLQDKAEDYMKKYNNLIAKYRVLETQSKQTTESHQALKLEHDKLLVEFDAFRKKTRRSVGQSRLADQQREELETLRHQNREYYRRITGLEQTLADKDRRLKDALAAKRSLKKKQAALEAELARSPALKSGTMLASRSFSGMPSTPGGDAGGEQLSPMSGSKSMVSLSRTSSLESLASQLQDEVDQAAFDRDEVESNHRQLEREHLHLRRIFALHFQHTLSDKERDEYEQLAAEYQQQLETTTGLKTELLTAREELLKHERAVTSAQEEASQVSEARQMAAEEVEGLKAMSAELTSANATMSEGLSAAWQAVEESDTKANQLESDLEAALAEVSSLKHQVEVVKDAASHQEEAKDDALHTTLEELQIYAEKAKELDAAVVELQAVIEEKEESLQVLESEVQEGITAKLSVEEESSGLLEQVQQLQVDLQGAQERENDLTSRVQELERGNDRLAGRIETLQAAESDANDEDLRRLRDTFEERALLLTETVREKEKEIETLKHENVTAEESTSGQLDQVHSLQDALRNSQHEKATAEENTSGLLDQVQSLQDALQNSQQEKATAEENTSGLLDQVKSLEDALQNSQHEKATAGEHTSGLLDQVQSLEDALQNSQLEKATAEENTSGLLDQVQSLQDALQQTQDGNADLVSRVKRLEQENGVLHSQHRSLQDSGGLANEAELQQLQQVFEEKEFSLNEAVRTKEMEVRRLTGQLQRFEAVQTKLKALQEENDALMQECGELREKASQASQPKITAEQEEMEAQLKSYKKDVAELTMRAEALTSTNECLNSELLLLWRLVSLELRYAESTGDRSVTSRLRELEKALESHSKVQDVVAEIMEERSRHHSTGSSTFSLVDPAYQRQSSELSDACREKDEKISELEAEIAVLASKLSVNTLTSMSSADFSGSATNLAASGGSPRRRVPRGESTGSLGEVPTKPGQRVCSPSASLLPSLASQGHARQPGTDQSVRGQPKPLPRSTSAQLPNKPSRSLDWSSSSGYTSTYHPPVTSEHGPVATFAKKSSVKPSSSTPASPGSLTSAAASGGLLGKQMQREELQPKARQAGGGPPYHVSGSHISSAGFAGGTNTSISPALATPESPPAPQAGSVAAAFTRKSSGKPSNSPLASSMSRSRHQPQAQLQAASASVREPAFRLSSAAPTVNSYQHQLYEVVEDYQPAEDETDAIAVSVGTIVRVYSSERETDSCIAECHGQLGRLPRAVLMEIDHASALVKLRAQKAEQEERSSSQMSASPTPLSDSRTSPADSDLEPEFTEEEVDRQLAAQLRALPVFKSEGGVELPPGAPRAIYVDKRLDKNLLVAWKLPPLLQGLYSNSVQVYGYRVKVNDDPPQDIQGPERNKVLIENVDPQFPPTISVATLAVSGATSRYVTLRDRPRNADGTEIWDPSRPRGRDERDPGGVSSPPMYLSELQHSPRSKPGAAAVPESPWPDVNDQSLGGPYLATMLRDFEPEGKNPHRLLPLTKGGIVEVLYDDPAKPYLYARQHYTEGLINRRSLERLPHIVAPPPPPNPPNDSEIDGSGRPLSPDERSPSPPPAGPPDHSEHGVARYDYSASKHRPNELSFRKGQPLLILGEMDKRGYLQVQIGEQYGLVPASFIELGADQKVVSPRSSTYVQAAQPNMPVAPRSEGGSKAYAAVGSSRGSDTVDTRRHTAKPQSKSTQI